MAEQSHRRRSSSSWLISCWGGGGGGGGGEENESSSDSGRRVSWDSDPLLLEDLSLTLAGSNLVAFTMAELKAATRNFTMTNLLGSGGFGHVYKGFVDERIRPGIRPQQVAVKSLDLDGQQGHREWLAEVVYLGQLRHPHLVKLIGYCCEDEHRMLVYEYMPRGSLENQLFKSMTACLVAVVDQADDCRRSCEGASLSPRGRETGHLSRFQSFEYLARRGLHGEALRFRAGKGRAARRQHPRHHARHGHAWIRSAGIHFDRPLDGQERRLQLRRRVAGATGGAAVRRQEQAEPAEEPRRLGAALPEQRGEVPADHGPEPRRALLRQRGSEGGGARLQVLEPRAEVEAEHEKRGGGAGAAGELERRAGWLLHLRGAQGEGMRGGRQVQARGRREEPAQQSRSEAQAEIPQLRDPFRGHSPQGWQEPVPKLSLSEVQGPQPRARSVS